jgi:hypothetical protein
MSKFATVCIDKYGGLYDIDAATGNEPVFAPAQNPGCLDNRHDAEEWAWQLNNAILGGQVYEYNGPNGTRASSSQIMLMCM